MHSKFLYFFNIVSGSDNLHRPYWMTKDVLLVSFSAFFADVGYQTGIALFPLVLVTALGASAYTFGLATAVAFGIGSFFGYLGGLMSSKFNDKYVAILGNAFIPLISLMGLASSPFIAIVLFCGGWWARNFRTPSRRAILVNATTKEDRGKAFGFLHMLDIGGGALSIVILLALLLLGISYATILLITILPLTVSTLLLLFTKETKGHLSAAAKGKFQAVTKKVKIAGKTYKGIIAATALYGFSSYSFGFPIITLSQVSGQVIAIASYGLYLGVSAIAGYYFGSRGWNKVRTLSLAGYMLSGLGTLAIAIGYFLGLGTVSLLLGVVILGIGLGAIETLEPTIISFIKKNKDLGKGMGTLAGSRSLGIFSANLIMGILYVFNPTESYLYAAIVALIAGFIVLRYGRGFSE